MSRPPDDRAPWTIRRVLEWTADRFKREGIDAPRLDAEVLLAHGLGVARIRLYTDYDKPLLPDELARFRGLVKRRLAREPVAYIVGEREFWSLALTVTPEVLVPRPETELLVTVALEVLGGEGAQGDTRERAVVVDVGTGSGAVAVAVARERPAAEVHATDISPGALAVAQGNAQRHGADVDFHQGDLLDALPIEIKPDLVLSNPPYVRSDVLSALAPEVRQHEPQAALCGGPDGLAVIRRLVPAAAARLRPGGHLALEIGHDQGPAVAELARNAGFEAVTIRPDLAGLDRVVTGRIGGRAG